MDGLTLAASVAEIRNALEGGRIEKIQQPEKYELLISVHSKSGSHRLLISSSSENCRLQLTNEKRPSPIDAPNFLMLLRKHLTGARISGIEQPKHDRIVFIRFEGFTELRDSTSFTLVCEIMGRHSNIILLDNDGIILDSIRRVSAGMSSVRLVLPKLKYEFPPMQDKLDPAEMTAEALENMLMGSERYEKALSNAICGLSPAVACLMIEHLEAELNCGELWLGEGEYDRMNEPEKCVQLSEAIVNFYDDLLAGREKPAIVKRGEKSVLLPFTPHGFSAESFERILDAADEFYRQRAESESVKRRTSSLEKVLTSAIARLERKAEKFALAIGDEAEIERLKLCGELVTANMYAIPDRAREAIVDNYYSDPPEKTRIELDETLSASDNAQQYYKKYRKAKSARDVALVMQKETLTETEYLRGILSSLSECLTDSDFEEVRSELAAGGYIRENRRKQQKLPKAKPHSFRTSDGFEILVGKNNIQNDRLTFKDSSPNDIWLHTKDIHGSHVILRCDRSELSDSALLEAAQLAAYYSQARNAPSAPVDYTRRRFVKKPNGAKPGMVIYTNQKTLIVAPKDHSS